MEQHNKKLRMKTKKLMKISEEFFDIFEIVDEFEKYYIELHKKMDTTMDIRIYNTRNKTLNEITIREQSEILNNLLTQTRNELNNMYGKLFEKFDLLLDKTRELNID